MTQNFYDSLRNAGFEEAQIIDIAMINERRADIERQIKAYKNTLLEVNDAFIKRLCEVYPYGCTCKLPDGTTIILHSFTDFVFTCDNDLVNISANVTIRNVNREITIQAYDLLNSEVIYEHK